MKQGDELKWAHDLLDRLNVPRERYEAQARGTVRFTLAGRIDWLGARADWFDSALITERHWRRRVEAERDAARDRADKATERLHQARNWITDASLALGAATQIGMRSCREGDHLNYTNHDRLIEEARAFLADIETETER